MDSKQLYNDGEFTGKKKNKAVVAINFGGYDNLHEPEFANPEWDYVYLTDRHYESDIWVMRKLPLPFQNPLLSSRWWICHFCLLGYDYVVKLDGNLILRADPQELTQYLRNGVAAYHHPVRDCLYDESNIIQNLGIDYDDIIDHQMNRYTREGFPVKYGLTATSIMVLKNVPLVRNLCRLWWQEIKEGSKRNQLSFDYARWKIGVEIGHLPGNLRDGKIVVFNEHNGRYHGVRGLG